MKRSILIVISLFFLHPYITASDKYPSHGTIDVIHYRFSIFLNDSSDVISGMAGIKVLFNGVTGSLPLDLRSVDADGKGMEVSRVVVDGRDVEWRHDGNRLVITPVTGFNPGDSASVTIYYSGEPVDGLIISRNKYGERTFFADNWPDRARNWIPCVDHPSDKATVEFIVYAPEYYSVVSNGQLFEESTLPGGLRVTHWKEKVEIPTKVMVIGVARFARQLSATSKGTGIWSWVFPDDRENGFRDYSVAVKPFAFFSETIGPYPYEKLANVQSKTMFGGMENAGCIFYYENSVTGNNAMENLMAHEISHQWFGNSVTENDWHHIWLSEGFATYFTAVYLESQYGEESMKSEMQRARTRVISSYSRHPAP
ncbi:MAG: M1 family metallopeptidase [Bacteroidales bacterium]